MSNGPEEPSADMRAFGKELRGMYIALTLEGFTTMQALMICGQVISAAFQANKPGETT